MEDELILSSQYIINKQCRSPSVASFVGLMAGKDCYNLTDADVQDALHLLQRCSWYYNNQNLTHLPWECISAESLYGFAIYYALGDKNFLDDSGQTVLTYGLLGANVLNYNQYEFYKEQLESAKLDNGVVKIVAIDSSIKPELFGDYMLKDVIYFGLAMIVILVVLFLYLRSVILTLATFLNVVFSFVLAFFIYSIVFRFPYFPFINILSALVLIAIGADNVFLFFDMWQQVKTEYPKENMTFWVQKMMRHAAVSVFVTSFTTAAAFYANYISKVTDIKCFGVFVGTAILCNFFLMVTWIPAIIVVLQWFENKFCANAKCCSCFYKVTSYLGKASQMVFEKGLPFLITHLWMVWLGVLTLLGIGGIVVLFVAPKLRLPSSGNFQVLSSTHPCEMYDDDIKYMFRGSSLAMGSFQGIDIGFVFGVEGIDNGSPIDPDSVGHLVFDETFDISSPDAQSWMLDFCSELKQQSFISTSERQRICALERFNTFMISNCPSPLFSPCCQQNNTKYDALLFKTCYPVFVSYLYGEEFQEWVDMLGTALFDGDNNVKAFRIELSSSYDWTPSYKETDQFYKEVDGFVISKSNLAPSGVNKGWFTGHWIFQFYDLQISLASGTITAFAVALSFSLLILFLMTLNVLITIYAIITITFTIFVTIGILVLIGWELNIVESIIICVAVGLSIDFTIHYGVAYKLSHHKDRKSRVRESFMRVGSSVFMAGLTTFLAGVCVMPTEVLAYSQFGTFLMIIMTVSWTYASFFFQSLCRIIGPNGSFTQLNITFHKCCKFCKNDIDSDNDTPFNDQSESLSYSVVGNYIIEQTNNAYEKDNESTDSGFPGSEKSILSNNIPIVYMKCTDNLEHISENNDTYELYQNHMNNAAPAPLPIVPATAGPYGEEGLENIETYESYKAQVTNGVYASLSEVATAVHTITPSHIEEGCETGALATIYI